MKHTPASRLTHFGFLLWLPTACSHDGGGGGDTEAAEGTGADAAAEGGSAAEATAEGEVAGDAESGTWADTGSGSETGSGSGSGSGSETGSGSGSETGSGSGSESGSGSDSSETGSDTAADTGSEGERVDLGAAGDYVILAKSGISTVPTSAVTGDLGISPADATYITGFSLIMNASNEFSGSSQVIGSIYAADYSAPTPSRLTTAVHDMETAFTDAAGRAPNITELGAGNLGGLTLDPGVYKWGTGVLIPTDVMLSGDATDVWIFQIAQDLTLSGGTSVVLSGGALPRNVFWQVSGLVDVGTTAHLEGVVLTQTAVTLGTGASVNGRLLAQTAVNIDGSTVVDPGR